MKPKRATYYCNVLQWELPIGTPLQNKKGLDFTLFLGSYFYRIYSHRTYLKLDILMCKMLHIKPLRLVALNLSCILLDSSELFTTYN